MNKQKSLDTALGTAKERYITSSICKHFNITQLTKLSHFHPLDFWGDNIFFEVKSRRNNHDKYESTMIGYNKIQYIQENKIENVYFIFIFEDGNYYYKYNTKDELETGISGRCDRGRYEYKPYVYIPITKLTQF